MIRYCLIQIIILLYASLVFAQDIILSNPNDIYKDSYIKVTNIDSNTGKIIDTRNTNIVSSNLNFYSTNIEFSGRGNYLIHRLPNEKSIYRANGGRFEKVSLQIKEATEPTYVDLYISRDESVLLEGRFDTEKHHVNLIFHNIIENSIISNFDLITKDNNNYTMLHVNHDASLLLFVEGSSLYHLIETNNDMLDDYTLDSIRGANYYTDDVRLSNNSKRIIYRGMIDTEDDRYTDEKQLFYIDRTNDGWSKHFCIPIKNKDGSDMIFTRGADGIIYDIADDGHTILFRTNDGTPALIHEENGVWSEPEYIEYERFDVGSRYDSGLGERFLMSDDGKVIAVQNLVKVLGGVLYYYNVYVLIKSPDGDWIRRNINPEGTYVVRDIYLTDDGSKLFWLPEGTSSVSNAINY